MVHVLTIKQQKLTFYPSDAVSYPFQMFYFNKKIKNSQKHYLLVNITLIL